MSPEAKDHNLDLITEALKSKATLKQSIYRNTLEVFDRLRNISIEIVTELSDRFEKIDKFVRIEMREINDFEFHIKFSGDLLIFTVHSNVISFPEEHILGINRYVQENTARGFFGHIMVYNFMADSLSFNRLDDAGYLVARLMVNLENHFYVEGVRQLNHAFPDIAQNQLNDELLRNLIEISMLVAIDNDLIATPYQDIQVITLGQKLANQMVSGGQKVGFQISAKSDESPSG